MELNKNDYSKYRNIQLSELENFFSNNALILLKEYEIFTLEDLFIQFEFESFLQAFGASCTKSNARLHNEIFGTTRLLRCKYLDENPNIPFDNVQSFINSVGFSSRIVSALIRNCSNCIHISIEYLFDMAKDDNFYELSKIRGIAEVGIQEIRNKIMIVYKYYKDSEKSVAILYSELQELLLELKQYVDEESYFKMLKMMLLSANIDGNKVQDVIEQVNLKIKEYK